MSTFYDFEKTPLNMLFVSLFFEIEFYGLSFCLHEFFYLHVNYAGIVNTVLDKSESRSF